MNDPEHPASAADKYIRDRAAYAIRVLAAYAGALTAVRESNVLDDEAFPNGM
jgi:hypothetical protein